MSFGMRSIDNLLFLRSYWMASVWQSWEAAAVKMWMKKISYYEIRNIWLPCWYLNDLHIVYLFSTEQNKKDKNWEKHILTISHTRFNYEIYCFVLFVNHVKIGLWTAKQMREEFSENAIRRIEHDANNT